MRVVLDTNLVVRAARPGQNLGRAILSEALSDRHTLILSNDDVSEMIATAFPKMAGNDIIENQEHGS